MDPRVAAYLHQFDQAWIELQRRIVGPHCKRIVQ